jgi:hypothetical protein
MKTSYFLVVLPLTFSLLAFNILPQASYSNRCNIEHLDISGIVQISKEYFPPSTSPALLASKSRPQIPSWHGRLVLEFPLRTHQPVGHFLLEAFLLPPTILELVSATVLRC